MTSKYEAKLNPPAYIPSEDEIKLAKIRMIFDDDLFSMITDLILYFTWKETGEKPSYLTDFQMVQGAQEALELWKEAMDNWKNCDWWEAFDPKDHYNYIVDGLSSSHVGDCTAHPATCMRCLSETLFKIPYTADWTKSEGHKMIREQMEEIKAKKVKDEQK